MLLLDKSFPFQRRNLGCVLVESLAIIILEVEYEPVGYFGASWRRNTFAPTNAPQLPTAVLIATATILR